LAGKNVRGQREIALQTQFGGETHRQTRTPETGPHAAAVKQFFYYFVSNVT